MGQYNILISVDKKEFVDPHKIGLGLKQYEHTQTVASLSDILYCLVMTSPRRGGGDLDTDGQTEDFKFFGRWAGDRVLVLGDYTEADDVLSIPDLENIYHYTIDEKNGWKDITDSCIPAFSIAFGVKIDTSSKGWRDRELDNEMWGWLVPDEEYDSKVLLSPDMKVLLSPDKVVGIGTK